jgi:hypothetical protein
MFSHIGLLKISKAEIGYKYTDITKYRMTDGDFALLLNKINHKKDGLKTTYRFTQK